MSITPRFLEEIKSRVSVSDVIGRAIKITKAGREYKACCPFHSEKSPSFTINDDKGFYHCFGCGAHGDVIGFVQQYNNMNFVDAVAQLSVEAGLEMPKPDPAMAKKAERDKDLYALVEDTAQFFQAQLQDSRNANIQEYVQSRGLTADDVANFRIGFAPHDRGALVAYLKQQGYALKDMIAAGVVKASSRGGDLYAFFNDRVMFPVADRRGRVIAFGGRTLPDHLMPPARGDYTPPKYLNSGDTPLFDKSRIVYAYTKARQASGEGQPIIVTEGYMDVIACHRAGFTGAIAPMGTALTEEQIVLLWKMMADDRKEPILCFDGDNAGRKAAVRALERIMPLLKPNHSARFAFLPDGTDPDDIIRRGGAKAFQSVLDASLTLIDFLWRIHTYERDTDTPESRAGIADDLRSAISKIEDKEVQSHYKALINTRISDTFFKRKAFGQNNRGAKPHSISKPKRPTQSHLAHRVLIAGVINHPFIYDDTEEEFCRMMIHDPRLRALHAAVVDQLNERTDVPTNRDDVLKALNARGFEKELEDVLSPSLYIHAAFVAPHYEEGDVLSRWRALFQSIEGAALNREIREGWERVMNSGDEDDEKSVIALMGMSSAE